MTAVAPGADARLRSVVLALALFVYLTCELFPIGALPQLSNGLDVSDGRIGLLLTWYAVAAGLATPPAVWLVRRIGRRRVLVASMVLLALAQAGFALAPSYAVAAGARTAAALAHGLVWSQVPVVAVRLAPAGAGGRAMAASFVGASAGLLLGAPLASASAQALGWRGASLLLGALALVAAVGLRLSLPTLPATEDETADGRPRWSPVLVVCVLTTALVVGHYVSYGYLALLAARAGVAGSLLPVTLAAYGLAGLGGVLVVGRWLDRRPGAVAAVVLVALSVALLGLAALRVSGPTVVLVALWGAAAAAMPVVLNTAVLRATDRGRDLASGSYIVAYQIGIGSGSALGAALLARYGAGSLPAWSGAIVVAGAIGALAARRTFSRT